MLKQFTALEHKVGDHVYHFMCAPDSPLGEIHDALTIMKDYVVQRIQDQHKLEEASKAPVPEVEKCAS